MKMWILFCLLTVPVFFNNVSAQDSLSGRVRFIREKLIFVDSGIQNRKLFSSEGDYGHYGFMSREFTLDRFNSWWWHTYWTHYLNYAREYDTLGRMISETWYNKKDNMIRRYENVIDPLWKRDFMQKEVYGDSSFELSKWKTDSNGNVVAKIETMSDEPGRFTYTYYQYRPDGKIAGFRLYDENGPGYAKRYEYDEKGRLTKLLESSGYKRTLLDGKRWLIRRTDEQDFFTAETYQYNSLDSLFEKSIFSKNDESGEVSLRNRTVYEYDSLKRNTRQLFYTDKLSSVRYFEYGKQGLITRDSTYLYYKTMHNERILLYEYNEDSTLRRLTYDEEGKRAVVDFDYLYDARHNWIEIIKKVDGRPLFIRKRSIEYWPDK